MCDCMYGKWLKLGAWFRTDGRSSEFCIFGGNMHSINYEKKNHDFCSSTMISRIRHEHGKEPVSYFNHNLLLMGDEHICMMNLRDDFIR